MEALKQDLQSIVRKESFECLNIWIGVGTTKNPHFKHLLSFWSTEQLLYVHVAE